MSAKKSESLSVVAAGLTQSGVEWRRNAVVFSKTFSLEQLSGMAARVAELGDGFAWWLGDIGLEIQARHREANELEARKLDKKAAQLERDLEHVEGKERDEVRDALRMTEKKAAELRDPKGSASWYSPEASEAMGIDDGYWRNCVMLCRFFKPSHRNDSLKPKHHITAMYAAGGAGGKVSDATKWLKRAESESWSASELRKQVNLSLADAPKEPAPLDDPFAELVPADRWAIQFRQKVPALSDADAIKLFTMTQALREFLAELQARVSTIKAAPPLRQETPEVISSSTATAAQAT